MTTPDYNQLKEFCYTERQKEIIDAIIENGTQKKAADALGIAISGVEKAIRRVKNNAALRGYSPEHDMTHTTPETHIVKGTSTLYKDGKVSLQWVKTNTKLEDQLKIIEEIAEALKEDLPKVPTIPKNDTWSCDKLAVYPMGDPHMGLLAFEEETNSSNVNLEVTRNNLVKAMARLVRTAPPCKEALIINLGDFFHSDFSNNRTERSGHQLDVDGSWHTILRVGIDAMRACIDEALKYHEKVTVFNCAGNHDRHSAFFLSTALFHIYENNPRIDIRVSPNVMHFYEYGKNLIGAYHGHDIKPQNLPIVMASEQKESWARTDFRVWYTGHIHHDSVKEYNGATVESFRTLVDRDRYTSQHGYKSHRDSKCIVLDKYYGEVERHTVNIAMIE